MAEQEQCKAQQYQCEKIWTQDIRRLEERFLFTDKALEVQQKEIERRMHESNNIKREFSHEMNDLKLQVGTLENKSSFAFKALGIGLAIFQIIIAVILKVLHG